MSHGCNYLHSHSGIERDIRLQKHIVLVDEKYKDLFDGHMCEPFTYKGRQYLKVDTYIFVRKGGIFKNLYL